ncbi:hypothetical protein [Ostreibacterium oceani]|uniref:Uncharacterized protein n=1 Tax=Ostreibacterium oceani TaxID=2654998 RepID=A0A6N7EXR5_9GAMM|nr:hypothetical protein [Ostreibacterium oceani]MPV86330.1 hypothetical protein [Ostreibacterium oceani]
MRERKVTAPWITERQLRFYESYGGGNVREREVTGTGLTERGLRAYKNSIKRLDLASEWVIQHGVQQYQQLGGKEPLEDKLKKDLGVSLRHAYVEADRYVDGFWLVGVGEWGVLNLYRAPYEGHFYEFWFVLSFERSVAKWPYNEATKPAIKPLTTFYVTKTDAIYGQREILERSEQFIPSYQLPDGHLIEFPQDDASLLMELNPWNYPDSYKNTTLDDKKIVWDTAKEKYVFEEDASFWDKLFRSQN